MNCATTTGAYAFAVTLPLPALDLPADLVVSARVLESRSALLRLLPRRAVMVEVGVGLGGFTREALAVCDPATFVAIDTFRLHELDTLWGERTEILFGGLSHLEHYRTLFLPALTAGTMIIHCGDSVAGIAQLDDGSVDVAYLDADHYYDAVRRDLAAIRPKMRADGTIILNDYVMVPELRCETEYGIVRAAHEFMLEHDWGLHYLTLQRQMFCDIALRPNHLLAAERSRENRLRAENAWLRGRVDALMRSRSWRITAPLRAVGGLLR